MPNGNWMSVGRCLPGFLAVCLVLMLGTMSSRAVAQSTTLYFSGSCTDCTGTGNLVLSANLTDGVQSGTPASVSYSSNLLGNLTSNAGSGQIFYGYLQSASLPGSQFMEIEFSALDSSGNDQLFTFTSCGDAPNVPVSAAGEALCGTASQVAAGTAVLAYGDWEVANGIFTGPNSYFPGGVGHNVQDYGTNGIWSETPLAAAAAPEIDGRSAIAALTLLLGGLAVARGRRGYGF